MALFDRNRRTADEDYLASSDAATRALSVTAVETDFVAGVYEKLASVYDYVFGPTLHAGRLQALQRRFGCQLRLLQRSLLLQRLYAHAFCVFCAS